MTLTESCAYYNTLNSISRGTYSLNSGTLGLKKKTTPCCSPQRKMRVSGASSDLLQEVYIGKRNRVLVYRYADRGDRETQGAATATQSCSDRRQKLGCLQEEPNARADTETGLPGLKEKKTVTDSKRSAFQPQNTFHCLTCHKHGLILTSQQVTKPFRAHSLV